MDLEKRCEVGEDGALTLHLIGELTGPETGEFKSWVTECLGERSASVVQINCHRLHFIDSSGLGSLIFARKQVLDAGGELRLVEVSGWLRKFLQVTGLEETFCSELTTEDQD
ncbi:MAG: STAS domain-containing protein [Planctomycetota bacterium]